MAGIVEEVTLNWTDLTGKKTGATALGSNKFYKAKIVDDGGTFTVHFNWGRVGQSGQSSSQSCGTLAAAQSAMNKKLNSKIKKGYTKVEMRDEDAEKAKAKAAGVDVGGKKKAKKKAAKKAKHYDLDAATKKLLKIMYKSTGDAIVKGLSSSAGASKDAPLGNLADSQLDKGADILDEAEALLAKSRTKKDAYVDLTNEYLSNIPREIDYARKGGRLDLDQILLNSQERIDEQRQFITLLRDAFLQKEVFAQAAEADDPHDVWYEGLNCTISGIDTKTDEFQTVAGYFDNGQSPKNSNFYGKLKCARAWKIERNGEKDPFDAYLAKMQKKKGATGLIRGWHGTRTANLMGISKSGLLMPENLPKGVHVTGKAFGMGIYHAPCWEDAGTERKDSKGKKYTRYNGALKSMNYTSMRGAYYDSGASGKIGYMFLQEIALGVPEVHLTACWNKKRPDAKKDYIYAQAWGNQRLSHDEIVTFDEDAQRITHILEIAYK